MEGDRTPLAELLRQINRFVDDLEHSLNDRIDLHVECDNAILCGMGGSAISGDVVADLCVEVSDIQIEVLRYPSLPGWVSKRTFAVVCHIHHEQGPDFIGDFADACIIPFA